ncbi:YeeE/YedE family protein [Rothia terrae]|uniref:YeeE/YedE family protein n=1 Tax=Rothia terrae TaxID=396015 RepID=A0A7H2BCV7_9MICC|nr:YeeE/YedE family protein [Rothia terrae]QNV37503.1 YeeE/YedE family protein [Rothia terrae]
MLITGLLVGAAFGFVLQRGRFCITGAFRDVWVSKNSWWLAALFVAISVQAIGLAAFNTFGILPTDSVASAFAPFATIAGGFIFGFGILMAGGCATGTYYRAGEGLVGSWFALIFYALFAAMFKTGPFAQSTAFVRNWGVTENATIYQSLGISAWVLVAVLLAVTGWWTYRNLTRPKLPMATLPPEKTGVAHLLFEKAWNPYITAILIGLIALAAWPLSWVAGRKWGLGITGPSSNIAGYLTTGNVELVDWGVFLVLGILVGSFIAAKASGEFKVRVPDSKTIVKSIIGGALMGWGASWAGGCTIGNGLVETSMFSWQGWIGLIAMILGTGAAAKIFIMPRKVGNPAAS